VFRAAGRFWFEAPEDEGVFVFEEPFEIFAFLQTDGLCQRDGEVDVIAAVGGAFDFLDFDWVTHGSAAAPLGAGAAREILEQKAVWNKRLVR
jgi:hypothetical protein